MSITIVITTAPRQASTTRLSSQVRDIVYFRSAPSLTLHDSRQRALHSPLTISLSDCAVAIGKQKSSVHRSVPGIQESFAQLHERSTEHLPKADPPLHCSLNSRLRL